MKNIIESLNNLYAAKLLNWQLEGRDTDVCYKIVKTIKDFKKRPLGCTVPIRFKKLGLGFVLPKDNEVINWIIGYCNLNDIELERKKERRFWLDENNIKHGSKEEEDFIYLFFISPEFGGIL